MSVFKLTIQKYLSDKYHGDILVEEEECLVEKKMLRKPVLLTEFGVGYMPGDVFDWCSIRSQIKPFGGGFHKITATVVAVASLSNDSAKIIQ
jgi:hypothetical protein